MDDSVLSLKNVDASYGNTPTIFDVSFDLTRGHIFGLMGLNGAGKTTLIKLILGLKNQSKGEINLFSGKASLASSRSDVAYLPERFTPPWFLSGYEFIKFSAGLYHKNLDDDFIFEASNRLALSPDVLKRRVHTYSKGMKQKLGILATLLSDCPLLILDEPMSGLDPQARVFVKAALKEVQQSGRSVFLSSHILADMDEICDHVGVIHQGKMVYSGSPSELKKKNNSDNMERAFLSAIESEDLSKVA
jgi:ABC-2 type transport system ATP-binding protein